VPRTAAETDTPSLLDHHAVILVVRFRISSTSSVAWWCQVSPFLWPPDKTHRSWSTGYISSSCYWLQRLSVWLSWPHVLLHVCGTVTFQAKVLPLNYGRMVEPPRRLPSCRIRSTDRGSERTSRLSRWCHSDGSGVVVFMHSSSRPDREDPVHQLPCCSEVKGQVNMNRTVGQAKWPVTRNV